MNDRKYWRITYLPSFTGAGVCEWVFKGTDEELGKYLNDTHGCNCEDCRGKDWWDTAQSCEFLIEDASEDD